MRNGFESLPQLAAKVGRLSERVDGNPIREDGWEELSGLLGKVSPEAADLARGLYLLDANAMRRTRDRLCSHRSLCSMPERFRDSLVMETLHAFAAMRPCRFCKGTGRIRHSASNILDESGQWLHRKGRWEPCEGCDGDGYDRLSGTYVQLAMKANVEVWERLLAQPFADLYRCLHEWHNDAQTVLSAASA